MTGTRARLYAVLLIATLLLGMAEVLRDNCGQTLMPALVRCRRCWSGPTGGCGAPRWWPTRSPGPWLGSFLLSVAFALPFFVDAGSFAVAAGLVFLIAGQFRAPRTEAAEQRPWRHELAEGVRWLRGHELLWPMAIILGLMNAIGMMLYATLVLYGQEVLGASATTFALMGTGGAIGGIVGSLAAPRVSQILGAGPSPRPDHGRGRASARWPWP